MNCLRVGLNPDIEDWKKWLSRRIPSPRLPLGNFVRDFGPSEEEIGKMDVQSSSWSDILGRNI
jgi:hypothetical protein